MLEAPEELLSFFELAVTCGELDYSGQSLVAPACWVSFVETHVWSYTERAAQAFGLVADIAPASSCG